LSRYHCSLRCCADVRWSNKTILGHGSATHAGLCSTLVSVCGADSRGLLHRFGRFAFAQLLRAVHVLVLAGTLDASRASPATKVVVDRVAIVRRAGSAWVVAVVAAA